MFRRIRIGSAVSALIGAIFLSSISVQAQTRSARIAAMAWQNIPGQQVFFDSRTPLSMSDLRAGAGESLRIEAHLWLPDNASGPLPAVIIFNCGAVELEQKEGAYSDQFHRQGYAVLNVNGLGARVDDVAGNLNSAVFKYRYATIVDALMSLKFLADDPRIDAKRIAIVGWTNGGTSILGADIEELRATYLGPNLHFAAIVPITPACSIATLGAHFSATPVLALLGEKDDFAPPKPCETYRETASARGAKFDMFVYPGAVHNWEMNMALHFDVTQTSLKDTCFVQADIGQDAIRLGDGRLLPLGAPGLADTVRNYIDSCRTGGITEGENLTLRRDALARVTDFIGKSFSGGA